MTRARDLADSADKDIVGTLNVDGLTVDGSVSMGNLLQIESTTGYGSIEMGGPSGAYIDFKSPFSDDFDARIITTGAGLILSTAGGSSSGISLQFENTTKLLTTNTGVDVTGTVKADSYENDAALPTVRPSLLLDFANSKTLDPRITFTRGSTATYWDGKTTTKAEENLLTKSEELTSNVFTVNGTMTANQTTAPDGTTTAELWTEDTSGNPHVWGRSNTSFTPLVRTPGTYTFSIYAKANGRTAFAFKSIATSTNWAAVLIDLSGGTATASYSASTTYSAASGTVTAVGNGWYRATFTFTAGSTFLDVACCLSDTTSPSYANYGDILYTGNGTAGVYFWGFQQEERSSATAYTATTTAPIVKYQPVLQTEASGEARFDHDPVTGESKGLLIEEARTNTETYSTGNVNYVGLGTQRQNAAVAPDGTVTALECIPNTVSSTHVFDQYGATQNTSDHTYSLFVKANGYTKCQLYYQATGFAVSAKYDLATGTIISSSSACTPHIYAVGNGWYRIAITCAPTSTNADIQRFQPLSDSGSAIFAGDDYKSMFIWGYQLEVGSFPTSYIPTSGSTVTRAVDNASMTGSNFTSWFSQHKGTLYADYTYFDTYTASPYPRIQITASNVSRTTLELMHYGGVIRSNVFSNNSLKFSQQRAVPANERSKSALSWNFEDGDIYSGIGREGTSPSTHSGTSVDIQYQLDGFNLGTSGFNAHIKKLAFYTQELDTTYIAQILED